MEELQKIPIEIKVNCGAFVSAQNATRIISLIEQAIMSLEFAELNFIRHHFPEIPGAIYDATAMRLHNKAGNALLIKEAYRGSIILGGVAAGLCIWLLNQTLGETVKLAWLDSESHQKLKEFLLKHMGNRQEIVKNVIEDTLNKNGIEASTEKIEQKIIVYVTPKEDEDISHEMEEKPRYRTR